MAKHDRKTIAESALANLAKALVGGASTALSAAGIPVVALVTKVFGDMVVDVFKERHGNDPTVQDRAERIRNEFAAKDIETLKKLILELAGIVPEDKAPIEALADAVADPDRIGEQELLRDAMMRLFDRAGRVSDEVQELAAGLETHINVQGPGAVGIRDIHATGDVHIETHVHSDAVAAMSPTAPQVEALRGPRVGRHAVHIALAKLPSTSWDLFGRDGELAALDEAWEGGKTNVVTLVAFGGVGKSALVNVWLRRMQKDGFRGARRVYGWSFYSQGTSEDRQASGDEFLSAALKWFGEKEIPKSAWDRGERLAQLCREHRTLLVLDGLEPLQHPPGERTGKLSDPGVQSLLRELAVDNQGLCVVSTRIAVDDLKDFENTSVRQVELVDLSPQAGGQLLAKLGVKGPDDELEQAAMDFEGHALALSLLGTYLAVVYYGDVRRRDEVPPLTVAARDGGHAKRVMECYERWFEGKPELCVLRMLGLFDRPAEGGAIDALRADKPIEHLTYGLAGISEADWKFALKDLRDVRLLAKPDPGAPDTLDCHPLIREYFSEKLRAACPDAWKKAHSRLYEYYKSLPRKEYPDTLEEMWPLFLAVSHGCHAGRCQEALDEEFYRRIQRKDHSYNVQVLGAFGADLAMLSAFFAHPWRELVDLEKEDQDYVLNATGYDLMSLGRLQEASEVVQIALASAISLGRWREAAVSGGNLSDNYRTRGMICKALEYAKQAVEFAEKSRDTPMRIIQQGTLGSVLQQAGRRPAAEAVFREGDQMQQDYDRRQPFLYSVQGFEYCELLLGMGEYQRVLKRAGQTLEWVNRKNWLLDIALDHLSLGRAALMRVQHEDESDFTEADSHLRQAVNGLREAGTLQFVPLGFLGRGELYRVTKNFSKAKHDLDEAMKIATRSGMRLFEADAHLEYARLHLEMGDKEQARTALAAGRKIVEDTGYHRRDGAVEELEGQLGKFARLPCRP